MNKHPYAEILHAIAEGKDIQIREVCDETWEYCQPNLFFANMNASRRQYEYCIAPATIVINDVRCPAPVNDFGAGGYAGADSSFSFVQIFLKQGHDETSEYLNANFETTEDAQHVYDALIKPFKVHMYNN